MEYFEKFVDDSGFIHSIDKLSIVWVFGSPSRFTHPFLDGVRDSVIDLCRSYDLEPEIKSSLKACSRFSWTFHFIKIRFGLPVFIGYQNVSRDGSIELKNVVRLEINPNKIYSDDRIFDDLVRLFNSLKPSEVKVNRLDYAIDIPVPLDDLVVLQSRKEKRCYKGTIYLGKRMGHGSIKIYDKQAEQNLDFPLTRFEITCRANHKIKFDTIQIMRGDKMYDEKITSNTKTIVKMCLALKEAGFDYLDFLKGLNSRKRKEVISFVEGIGQSLVFDDAIFDFLYKETVDRLNLGIDFPVYRDSLIRDLNGFLDIDDNVDIPFNDI